MYRVEELGGSVCILYLVIQSQSTLVDDNISLYNCPECHCGLVLDGVSHCSDLTRHTGLVIILKLLVVL